MREVLQAGALMEKLQRRTAKACLGPLTIADVEVGWSPTVVGKLKGRIDIPGALSGYLFLDLKLFNKQVLLICWQLA